MSQDMQPLKTPLVVESRNFAQLAVKELVYPEMEGFIGPFGVVLGDDYIYTKVVNAYICIITTVSGIKIQAPPCR